MEGGCTRIVSVVPMRGGFGFSRLCWHHPDRRITALDIPPEGSKVRSRQRWWGCRGIKAKALSVWVGELQTFEHEQHQLLPALEAHVLFEHAQVLKESVAPRQGSTDEGTAMVQQFQRRVKQEGQQVQRQQCLGEEQLAMAEIVLKVVALSVTMWSQKKGPPLSTWQVRFRAVPITVRTVIGNVLLFGRDSDLFYSNSVYYTVGIHDNVDQLRGIY